MIKLPFPKTTNNEKPKSLQEKITEKLKKIKEAYNRIRIAPNLAQYPLISETGIYDIETSTAIGKSGRNSV